VTTTSKRNQPSIWFSDLEVECKSSLRLWLERPSPWTLSHQIPSIMSRLKSKTRKVSHPINKDSSLLVNNWKTAEPSPIITSKRNQLSTWSSDWEEVCKSSLRHWLERPSLLTLNHLTLLITLKLRSRTKKESHPINRDLSSLESNLKMEEPYQTTTSRRNQPSTWSLDLEEVCKSSSRPLLERPSHSMLNHQTPLTTLRPRFKIRKESPPINKDSFSPESNLKMAELFLITTSRRNLLFTWFSDWEEVNEHTP